MIICISETVAPHASVWIGIHLRDGRWISSYDDTSVTYEHWGENEPNNNSDELCATFRESWQRQWADNSCNMIAHAVCEIDM